MPMRYSDNDWEDDGEGPRHPDSCENWPRCRRIASHTEAFCRECQRQRERNDQLVTAAVRRWFKESA